MRKLANDVLKQSVVNVFSYVDSHYQSLEKQEVEKIDQTQLDESCGHPSNDVEVPDVSEAQSDTVKKYLHSDKTLEKSGEYSPEKESSNEEVPDLGVPETLSTAQPPASNPSEVPENPSIAQLPTPIPSDDVPPPSSSTQHPTSISSDQVPTDSSSSLPPSDIPSSNQPDTLPVTSFLLSEPSSHILHSSKESCQGQSESEVLPFLCDQQNYIILLHAIFQLLSSGISVDHTIF